MRTPWQPDDTHEHPEPSAMDIVRLRRLNRWQAEGMREDLADLYVESSETRPGDEFRGREDFLQRLADAVQLPGFDMLVAEARALTGCVFGYPAPRDGSWWEGFDGPLPQNLEQLTASGHVFAILETVVHPHEHARGLARRLQERLLNDHQASLGATLADPSDRTARATFEKAGGGADPQAVRARPGSPARPGPPPRGALTRPSGRPCPQCPDATARIADGKRPRRTAPADSPGSSTRPSGVVSACPPYTSRPYPDRDRTSWAVSRHEAQGSGTRRCTTRHAPSSPRATGPAATSAAPRARSRSSRRTSATS